MKCNVDYESSHIVNRNAPMILFGFDAAAHDVLDYKVTDKDIIEAEKCASAMDMKFPVQLFQDAMEFDNIGKIIKIEALHDGTWGSKRYAICSNKQCRRGFWRVGYLVGTSTSTYLVS
ncbi:MAG: hypothetical protein WA323_02725 [Candidatus Nitrosopolaris sp.]